MAETEDNIGCILGGAFSIFAGIWAYNHYTIKKIEPPVVITPTYVGGPPPPIKPSRPTGLIYVTSLEDGTIWRLDADSVIGPRRARQFWIKADHSKSKTITARETQTYYRVNCDTTGIRTLKVVEYDKDGKVLRMFNESVFGKEDDYMPPESILASAIRTGCDRAYDTAESAAGKK